VVKKKYIWIDKEKKEKTLKEINKWKTTSKWWRPSEYDIIFLRKEYVKYLKKSKDSWFKLVKSNSISNTWSSKSWENKLRVKIPTMEWFAIFTWFAVQTFERWEKEKWKEEFANMLNDLRTQQAQKLIVWWLSWIYNPTITKLLLSKHWYIEKREEDLNLKWKMQVVFARPASPFNSKDNLKK